MASLTRPLPLLLLTCMVASTIAACSRERTPEPARPAPAKPAPVADGEHKDAAEPAPATTRLTVYSGDYDALALQPPAPSPGMPGFALVDNS